MLVVVYDDFGGKSCRDFANHRKRRVDPALLKVLFGYHFGQFLHQATNSSSYVSTLGLLMGTHLQAVTRVIKLLTVTHRNKGEQEKLRGRAGRPLERRDYPNLCPV